MSCTILYYILSLCLHVLSMGLNPLHPNNAAPCSCECAPVMLHRASVTAPQ